MGDALFGSLHGQSPISTSTYTHHLHALHRYTEAVLVSGSAWCWCFLFFVGPF
jgi:hypothetical protein